MAPPENGWEKNGRRGGARFPLLSLVMQALGGQAGSLVTYPLDSRSA